VTSERAREEQLRLLDAAVARQNDILLITEAEPIDGPEGPRIIYVNDAFVRLTGYGREEAIGRTPRFLQGPETQRAELDRIRAALEAREPVRVEVVNYTKGGAPLWLELDIAPLNDAAGRCTHFVAVQRDITARKQAETALRVSEERFRLITRATHDVIWDFDVTAGELFLSENLLSVYGYDAATIASGRDLWRERLHPEDRDRVIANITAALAGTGATWSDEYRFLRADGAPANVIDRGFIIRDDSGAAVRMVGSMMDVTEQRRLDDRLRQAQKLEAVGLLTGGIAHDFNNLLTVILGGSEVLAEEIADEELRSLAEMTITAARRGAELTNRLLAFARRQPLAPRRVDLGELAQGLEGLLRRTLSEAIEIRVTTRARLWPTEIDPGQLENAVLNLAINARDAMPAGGRLTIETANAVLDEAYAATAPDAAPGEYVMVAVSDTGTGMAPETLARVFEPFFTTKEAGRGSGLGLSMVYGFARQSGGHVRIYSELGQGTTVRMYFPRAADRTAAAPEDAQAAPAAGGAEHILVVEDDPLVRRNLTHQLGTLGYRVTAAEAGAEALAIIEATPDIDLLLTDVVMPGGMNGAALAAAARVRRPDLRVLYTSGYAEDAIVHHGRLDPGVELLAKPYRRQELAAKVRLVLDRDGTP
jgi:PAS domain S-box-containing protein